MPPPGDGFATETESEVPEARTDAGIEADNPEEDENVVTAGVPFRRICDAVTKLLPPTAMVVAGDPTARVAGEIEATWGIGLLTKKLTELEGSPPGDGFVTTRE